MSEGTDSSTMRQVLGHFPSGVTIVTGTTPDGPAGFTCQSFSSLSLEPPLVLVLPGRSSSSWPKIEATGRFVVNVLSEEQEELSTTFAVSGGDKFADLAWRQGVLGAPILERTIGHVECRIVYAHEGGDHTIYVGEIECADVADGEPLVYFRGAYRGVV